MRAEIIEAISEATGASVKDIEQANALEDIGIDSLDVLELVFAIENRFSISIKNEELTEIETIDDLVGLVQHHVTSRAGSSAAPLGA